MLTAASPVTDVMQTDLVTARPADSLKEAMTLLMDSHVSGLPVLDPRGGCVGVLSVTDILGLEYAQAESATEVEEVGVYFNPDEQRWENMRFAGGADELPDLTVGEVMTTEIVSVSPDASVREVAELMVERRVHRILVLDDRQRLRGLVAALDLVQVVAEL